ncbi:MAG: hypothetical protein ABIU87_11990 [Ornithinibacter sp.]
MSAPAIGAIGLVKRFGDFTAVEDVDPRPRWAQSATVLWAVGLSVIPAPLAVRAYVSRTTD